ncbi:MAG: hypothetical protein D6753_09260 [Planctomycetota bacterium]|nr:MAG: hypothetical protein D6753_09260 [Planctomycetota bacterium]
MKELDADQIGRLDLALEPVFKGVDQRIVQRLREEAETEEARRALIEQAGIDDPKLIEECAQLGVTIYGLVALRLVPLVLVAWAEDFVDPKERLTIIEEARKFGIREGSVAEALLDYWLRTRPSRELLDAWKRLIQIELKRLTPKSRRHFIEVTQEQMERVAKASGGKLGMGKVSKAERQMIEGLVYIMEKASRS